MCSVKSNPVLSETWRLIVIKMTEIPNEPVAGIIEKLGLFEKANDWEQVVEGIINENLRKESFETPEKQINFIMGKAMTFLRGKIPGSSVNDVVVKKLQDNKK